MKTSISNKKGFTLVELLVVISIIALLLAVMLPALSKAKEQARIIVCKSNLHNYVLASKMYLEANNQVFPNPAWSIYSRDSNTPQHPQKCHWHDAGVEPDGPLWPYLAAKNVHCCPTFAIVAKKIGPHKCRQPNGTLLNPPIPVEPQITYAMNGYLSPGDSKTNLVKDHGDMQMTKSTSVKHPSEIIFWAEENLWPIHRSNGDKMDVGKAVLDDTFFRPKISADSSYIATFHKAPANKLNDGFSNVLFVDGHVELKKAYNDKNLRNGGSDKSWTWATGRPGNPNFER